MFFMNANQKNYELSDFERHKQEMLQEIEEYRQFKDGFILKPKWLEKKSLIIRKQQNHDLKQAIKYVCNEDVAYIAKLDGDNEFELLCEKLAPAFQMYVCDSELGQDLQWCD